MAVGLKTLLEAAQYLEEQEQQQKSPLPSNNLNGVSNHLNNDTNTSCFIAHYSLAVAGNRNAATTAAVNGTSLQTVVPTTTGNTATILNDENHKLANIEGFFANGHAGLETPPTTAADLFPTRKSTCQNIVKNTGNKKQQQNIATSAPASTGFQQQVAAFDNGFSLTTKTKSPTELFISAVSSDRKDVNETNNNCSKGQLITGAIIQQQQQQQHMNNHHSTLPTNTITSNILNGSAKINNNNNNHHKFLTNNKTTIINTINNNNINNDDFDSNSLSPPGPQRVRSASTSSNVYVFGSLDHAKSAANHANRLQANAEAKHSKELINTKLLFRREKLD